MYTKVHVPQTHKVVEVEVSKSFDTCLEISCTEVCSHEATRLRLDQCDSSELILVGCADMTS